MCILYTGCFKSHARFYTVKKSKSGVTWNTLYIYAAYNRVHMVLFHVHRSRPLAVQFTLDFSCFGFILWSKLNAILEMAGASRERPYQDKFIEQGFYYVTDRGVQKPQCVICYEVLRRNPWNGTSYNGICQQNIQLT